MTTSLENTQRWWRPVLGVGTAFNCIAYPWAALVIAFFKPDAASHLVAMMMALFGFAASLYGLRQWGKNVGAE